MSIPITQDSDPFQNVGSAFLRRNAIFFASCFTALAHWRKLPKLAPMPATRILWGAILVVFSIVLVTTWGATQWTAYRLAFQAELGPAWFRLGALPVYPPPAFYWWWYRFDAYAPRVFIEGAGIAASGGVASIVAAIGMSVARAREAKNVVTYQRVDEVIPT